MTEELKGGNLLTQNTCRRMIIGAMSQLLVEKLDEMVLVDPIWRNKLKNTGNSFLRELDKETNLLMNLKGTDEQMLKLTNIIEDELKDVFSHMEKEVNKVVNYEKDKPKEVHKEV